MSVKTWGAVLTLLVVVSGIGLAAAPTLSPEELASKAMLPAGTEILELRNERARHYSNGDGRTITAKLYSAPIFRLNESGKWEPIVTETSARPELTKLQQVLNEIEEMPGPLTAEARRNAEARVRQAEKDDVSNVYPQVVAYWTGYVYDYGSGFQYKQSDYPYWHYYNNMGYIFDCWVKYDLSSLPAPITVTAASQFSYGWYYSRYEDITGDLRYMDCDPVSADAATIGDAIENGPIISNTVSLRYSYSWLEIPLDATGCTYVENATTDGWIALGGKKTPGTKGYYQAYGHSGGSQMPYLAITYTILSNDHDVTVSAIVGPKGLMAKGDITPQATVKNNGLYTETFDTRMIIGSGYTQDVSVGSLSPGEERTIDFPTWTATGGTFAVSCSTRLSGDQYDRNDKKVGTVMVADFVENFDYSDGNFIPSGDWTWKAPESPRPPPPSEPYCWCNPPSGNYKLSARDPLISSTLVATQDNPMVLFNFWMSMYQWYDGGNCSYSTDGGSSWTLLYPASGFTAYYGQVYGLDYEYGYSGDYVWQLAGFTVPVNNGTSFLFRWKFGTSPWTNYYTDDGWNIDDFAGVGAALPVDVMTKSITSPTGEIPYGSPVTPTAVIRNSGSGTQTFDVKFDINNNGYSSTKPVTNLAANAEVSVDFDPWTPLGISGEVTYQCSTRLSTDQVQANDKKTGKVTVNLTDAGGWCITIPAGGGMMDSGTTVTPRCSVMNYGNKVASFGVDLRIGSGYSASGNATSVPANSKKVVAFSTSYTAVGRGWVPMSCSTKLSGDQLPADDLKSDSVFLRIKDIGAVAITAPVGAVLPGPVTPSADVHNYGNSREACKVIFRINSIPVYRDSVVLPNGLPYADTNLTFASWTAVEGAFTAVCSTKLAGDLVAANNVATSQFVVGSLDVGVTVILAPVGSIDTSFAPTPSAKMKNTGTAPATGVQAFFSIDDGTDLQVYLDTVLVDIPPGGEVTVMFDPWPAPHAVGTYLTKCKVFAAGDGNPANDSLMGTFVVSTGPGGWSLVSEMPPGAKAIKDGAWLVYDGGIADAGLIFASRGNKTLDFFSYDPATKVWTKLADWLPGVEAKPPSKGSAACSDGNGTIYATKGNNKSGFWKYAYAESAWTQLLDVPLGGSNKKVKGGTGLAWAYKDTVGSPYLLKGYKNEFYRYDVASKAWLALPVAPIGGNQKWDKGSWLVSDGAHTLYAHKAKYHEFYSYDTELDTWSGPMTAMPIAGSQGNKKSKDGGAGAYMASTADIYAFKGGNTTEFWKCVFAADANSWGEKETIPRGTLKKKVKAGGSIVAVGTNFYAIKGNKTNEFWMYKPGSFLPEAPAPRRDGMLAGKTEIAQGMSISPNPLASGFAVLRYGLPSAGAARLSVYNMAGQRVMARTLAAGRSGNVNLDLRHLSNGVYLVKLSSDGFENSQKLVVQR